MSNFWGTVQTVAKVIFSLWEFRHTLLFFYYTIIYTVSTIKKKNLVANDYPNDYLCLKLKY